MKIGSVPYLNARPLVDELDRHPPAGVTISYAIPSVLVAQLLAGEVDIAMVSTFCTLEHPHLHLLPDIGVTVTGPAWSVRLFSTVPLEDIRTLALDASSRSTNALARIVLAEMYGVTPACRALPPDAGMMLRQADAAVLIGDIGLAAPSAGIVNLDLGAAWHALTGLPFFFAGWVARDDAVLREATPLLHAALDAGLARLPVIAEAEAQRLGIAHERCYQYLAEVMRYHAGAAERAGLAEFGRRAQQHGLLPEHAVERI